MDKMRHLAYRTAVALNKSVPFLNDVEVFGRFCRDDQLLSKESEEIFEEEEENIEDDSVDHV